MNATTFGWEWERVMKFDSQLAHVRRLPQRSVRWIDWRGNPIRIIGGVTANSGFESTVHSVVCGEALGNVGDLFFRDQGHFRAGELHNHLD